MKPCPLGPSPAHLQGPQAAPHLLLVAQWVGGGQQQQQGQQAAWSRDTQSHDTAWGSAHHSGTHRIPMTHPSIAPLTTPCPHWGPEIPHTDPIGIPMPPETPMSPRGPKEPPIIPPQTPW